LVVDPRRVNLAVAIAAADHLQLKEPATAAAGVQGGGGYNTEVTARVGSVAQGDEDAVGGVGEGQAVWDGRVKSAKKVEAGPGDGRCKAVNIYAGRWHTIIEVDTA
jgi:hypothetical protein